MKIFIEWAMRPSGMRPACSAISRKIAFQKIPNLLLYYYESRLIVDQKSRELKELRLPRYEG